MGKTLKYMGGADVRRIPKDFNFGGRLKTATTKEVVFNRDNHWIVDSSDAGLSDEAVNLMLESGDFEDVSNAERIPTNQFQRTFLSMRDEDEPAARSNQQDATAQSNDSKDDDDSKSSKSKSSSKS